MPPNDGHPTTNESINQWLLPEKDLITFINYFRFNVDHGFLFDRTVRSCSNKCRSLGPGDPRLSLGLTFISFFSLQNNFSLDLKKGLKVFGWGNRALNERASQKPIFNSEIGPEEEKTWTWRFWRALIGQFVKSVRYLPNNQLEVLCRLCPVPTNTVNETPFGSSPRPSSREFNWGQIKPDLAQDRRFQDHSIFVLMSLF